MTTRLYWHPIYLEHLTPPGHPERPDRIRALMSELEGPDFYRLDRVEAPRADEAAILLAHPEEHLEAVRGIYRNPSGMRKRKSLSSGWMATPMSAPGAWMPR